jgi:hypothetical protein
LEVIVSVKVSKLLLATESAPYSTIADDISKQNGSSNNSSDITTQPDLLRRGRDRSRPADTDTPAGQALDPAAQQLHDNARSAKRHRSRLAFAMIHKVGSFTIAQWHEAANGNINDEKARYDDKQRC